MSPDTWAPKRRGSDPTHSGTCTRAIACAATASPTPWPASSIAGQSRGVFSTDAAMTAKATQWAMSNRPCMRP